MIDPWKTCPLSWGMCFGEWRGIGILFLSRHWIIKDKPTNHRVQGKSQPREAITSLTVIITTHLPKCEEKLGASLQIIAGKTFHLQYSIFSLLSASLQCCLVAWSSSSIVQGYQSIESLLQLRPARALSTRRGGAGDKQSFGNVFWNTAKFLWETRTFFCNTRQVKYNSSHWVVLGRQERGWDLQQVIEGLKNHSRLSNRVFKNIILIETHTEDSQIQSVYTAWIFTQTPVWSPLRSRNRTLQVLQKPPPTPPSWAVRGLNKGRGDLDDGQCQSCLGALGLWEKHAPLQRWVEHVIGLCLRVTTF